MRFVKGIAVRTRATAPFGPQLGCCIILTLSFAPAPVRADGDDFFTYRSRSLNSDGTRVVVRHGFIGNVKDDDGNPLPDATITIAVNVRSDGDAQRLTYNAYTNVVGRYRSLDAVGVVSDLLGIETELQPGDIELVGVEKDGYVEVRRMNRGRPGQSGVVEVDFVMKRVRRSR